jgi:hypothetical protein
MSDQSVTNLVTIQLIAEQILQENPDPVVRKRLLRDVLFRPTGSETILQDQFQPESSHWVQLLEEEQWADGSWGNPYLAYLLSVKQGN